MEPMSECVLHCLPCMSRFFWVAEPKRQLCASAFFSMCYGSLDVGVGRNRTVSRGGRTDVWWATMELWGALGVILRRLLSREYPRRDERMADDLLSLGPRTTIGAPVRNVSASSSTVQSR